MQVVNAENTYGLGTCMASRFNWVEWPCFDAKRGDLYIRKEALKDGLILRPIGFISYHHDSLDRSGFAVSVVSTPSLKFKSWDRVWKSIRTHNECDYFQSLIF